MATSWSFGIGLPAALDEEQGYALVEPDLAHGCRPSSPSAEPDPWRLGVTWRSEGYH